MTASLLYENILSPHCPEWDDLRPRRVKLFGEPDPEAVFADIEATKRISVRRTSP
jgi:hypothetical protein